MSLPEVVSVRLDEIKQKKVDSVSAYITYIGRADFTRLPSQPFWQILRKTIKNGVESTTYAGLGEYVYIWDNRASYFPPPDIGGPIDGPEENPEGVAVPTIAHLSMPLANTEYHYDLPTNTKKFMIQTQAGAKVQYAFEAGESGIDFWTVQPYNWAVEDDIIATNLTIYVQSPKAGQILQIKSWQ